MDHQDLRRRMAPELPAGLLEHIDRVVVLGGELAARHGLDAERVQLAAQGHDVLRALDDAELLARAEARGMAIEPTERAAPLLLHGPLGALELSERFGVDDEPILHAVRWHTTGHPDFDPEAWAFFVADKAEPEKLRRWPELERVLNLAADSLEAAALAYLELSAGRAEREGWQPHPVALRARETLIERRRGARHRPT